ncbi:unnamed protein product [Cuscuta epithymum]|uniref:Uncharacterized protein n=1 Tax=Cuscuta epithymum TaxID=186058 RepID=A0AAV0EW60_9ASTE|nr:unnamed protein product [Cuscuta epithymum]
MDHHPKSAPTADSRRPTTYQDPDTVRRPKRQRSCPTPLHSVGRSDEPSFTFDTKISDDSAPETTPRFGFFSDCIKTGKLLNEDQIGDGEVGRLGGGGDYAQNQKRAVG